MKKKKEEEGVKLKKDLTESKINWKLGNSARLVEN